MRRLLLLALAPLLQADDAALLRSSLAKLQTAPQAALPDVEPDSPVDRVAMKMPLTDPRTPWRARYLAAEWLLQAHLLRRQADPIPAVARERKDLEQAWTLITLASDQSRRVIVNPLEKPLYRGSDPKLRVEAAEKLSDNAGQARVSPAFQATMDTLALEIAVRLEDADRMAKALEPILRHPQLQPRDKAFALMASAHTGRWEAARAWGRQLAGAPAFTALHDRALRLGEGFDYTVFTLPGFEPAAAVPPFLPAAAVAVKEYRIRLAGVDGGAGAEARLRDAYGTGWHASGPATPLQRQGALARWQAPGDGLPPLTGPHTPDRLQLVGYLDQPKGRRIDTLDLTPDAGRPGVWVGTFRSDRPSEAGRTVLRFEAELELQAPLPR